MTSDELAAAGRILYGERWQTSLALELEVADRTIRRWLAGITPIPGNVEGEIRDIIIQRLTDIGDLIGCVADLSERTVVHYPTHALFRFDDALNLVLVSVGTAPLEELPAIRSAAHDAVRREQQRAPSTKEKMNKLLFAFIIDIDFSVRTSNCLQNNNVTYLGDLVQQNELDLLRIPNFGHKSVYEIKEKLARMNLYLGMKVPAWPPENLAQLAEHHRDFTRMKVAQMVSHVS